MSEYVEKLRGVSCGSRIVMRKEPFDVVGKFHEEYHYDDDDTYSEVYALALKTEGGGDAEIGAEYRDGNWIFWYSVLIAGNYPAELLEEDEVMFYVREVLEEASKKGGSLRLNELGDFEGPIDNAVFPLSDIEIGTVHRLHSEGETKRYREYVFGKAPEKYGVFFGINDDTTDVWLSENIELEDIGKIILPVVVPHG